MDYTKGEWTFSPQQGKKGHCFQAQVWDSEGKNLATIEDTSDAQIATNNARLIAAAPDMYEALIEARRMLILNTLLDKSGQTDEAIKLVEKALKKAGYDLKNQVTNNQ